MKNHLSNIASEKKYWFSIVFLLFLTISIFLTLSQIQKRQTTTTKAAVSYPGNLTGKFQEVQALNLTSPSQIYGYFTTDHKNITISQSLPSTISLSNGTVTFAQKGGIIIVNPLKNEPFYKIEVTMTDTEQTNLESYLTPIDNLWANGVTTNGLSIGINTNKSGSTYWYWHTELKQQGQIPDTQYNFSMAAHSKFIRRQAGAVKLEIYVTPNGRYAVVNGANFGSFPNTYIGSYTYRGTQPMNYIALAKWDSGSESVTFQNLKVIKLDNVINNVDEVNAYFIKRTVGSPGFGAQDIINKINQNGGKAGFNGTNGYADALWAAFLYRAYDYYFKTNHFADVQRLVDTFLQYYPADVDTNIARYGKPNVYDSNGKLIQDNSTLGINHSFINSNNWVPMVVYGIGSYLRPDQKAALQTQFAKVVDKSQQYISVKFPSAPCAGVTAGRCVFNTRTQADVNGQLTESITAYGKGYNWYPDLSPWPGNGFDLTSIARYAQGPCSGKTPGMCTFDTRAFFKRTNGSEIESITAYGKYYNWDRSSDGRTFTAWPSNGSDLTTVSFYAAGPCSGRAAGTCTFDTRTQANVNGQLMDSVTAYGRGYNWNPDYTPWPNNGFDLNSVARYAAGPCSGTLSYNCKFDSRSFFTKTDGSVVESITAYGKNYNWTMSADGRTYTAWPDNGSDMTSVFRYIGETETTSFPYGGQNYINDTFAEEVSWLLTFYAGYYVSFPQDNPRSAKILDYLKFLGFHHMSTGQSMRLVYGNNVTFTYLPDNWRDFVTQYIWTTGEVDNHAFHPSLNYAQSPIGSNAVVRNVLVKNGVTIPTLSYNLDLTYQKNIIGNLDINTFRLKHPNPSWDSTNTSLSQGEDHYKFASDGSITDFSGYTWPSLVEDWSSPFTNYHIIENYGDYALALPFARNVYYSYYSGSGKLFCGHAILPGPSGSGCSASSTNFYNYNFGDALYAMLFSQRSSFDPTQGPPPASTPTPTPTPIPTSTPRPTNTPTPTSTPIPCPSINPPAYILPIGSVTAGSQSISWGTVSGATGYNLRIDDNALSWNGNCTSPNAGDICIDRYNGTSYSFNFQANHTYRIWVHADNGCQMSSSISTTVIATVPPTPTRTPTVTPTPLPTPPPPSNLSGTCPTPGTRATLSWSAVLGANHYALRADDMTDPWNGTCSSVNGDFCTDVTTTSYSFNTIPGHTYAWWVHTLDNNNQWSPPAFGVNFICASSPTATPTKMPTPTTITPTPTISVPTPTPILPSPTPSSSCTIMSVNWGWTYFMQVNEITIYLAAQGNCNNRNVTVNIIRSTTGSPGNTTSTVNASFNQLNSSSPNFYAAIPWQTDPWFNACITQNCNPNFFFPPHIDNNLSAVTIYYPF